MSEPLQVALSTAPNRETALSLARALVSERLAACVNLVPQITSVYRWQGAVEEDEEVLLVAKTRADRAERLCARIVELHPYDVPEVILLPVAGGAGPYLDWVRTESEEETR